MTYSGKIIHIKPRTFV